MLLVLSGCSTNTMQPSGLQVHPKDVGMESDTSSAEIETLSVLQLGVAPSDMGGSPAAQQQGSDTLTHASSPDLGVSPILQGRNRASSIPLKSQGPATSHAQPRKGQGYRRLWQMVSRVQRGERLSESNTGKEDVTVSVPHLRTVRRAQWGVKVIAFFASHKCRLNKRASASQAACGWLAFPSAPLGDTIVPLLNCRWRTWSRRCSTFQPQLLLWRPLRQGWLTWTRGRQQHCSKRSPSQAWGSGPLKSLTISGQPLHWQSATVQGVYTLQKVLMEAHSTWCFGASRKRHRNSWCMWSRFQPVHCVGSRSALRQLCYSSTSSS